MTNDPWQILVIALLFFVPGVVLLCNPGSAVILHLGHRRPVAIFQQGYRYTHSAVEVVPMNHVRTYGVFALLVAGGICAFYLWLRQEIRRDELPPYHTRQR